MNNETVKNYKVKDEEEIISKYASDWKKLKNQWIVFDKKSPKIKVRKYIRN